MAVGLKLRLLVPEDGFKSEDGDFSVSFVVFTFHLEMKAEMSIKHLETIL